MTVREAATEEEALTVTVREAVTEAAEALTVTVREAAEATEAA